MNRYSQQIKIAKFILENSHEYNSNLFVENNIDDLIRLLFLNKNTLQLTIRGMSIVKTIFISYEITLPTDYVLTSRDIIILSRQCSMPYYIYARDAYRRPWQPRNGSYHPYIILFERDLASLLKLCDGDIAMIGDMHPTKNF